MTSCIFPKPKRTSQNEPTGPNASAADPIELSPDEIGRFGLLPGTEVEFVAEADALRIKPRKRGRRAASPFDAWLTKAAGSASTRLTTDQIMATTRGED